MSDPERTTMQDLPRIRKQIRKRRQDVPESVREQSSRRIGERIESLPQFGDAKKIAGFLAFDGEADPLVLMELAIERGKRVYVPIIIGKGKPLAFAPWTPSAKMKTNRFGIKEPDVSDSERVEPSELDFVITPLVAFDSNCHRIGVGGGYYDRSFEFVKSGGATTTLIGFAFEVQKLDSIVPNPWDVTLHGVATESDFYSRDSVRK